MSGAAEGIAGLALSVVSVTALFTTYIECFDIVVAVKSSAKTTSNSIPCSHYKELVSASGGFCRTYPEPSGSRLQYDKSIDCSDIRPGAERIFLNIKSLLEEARRMDKRYRSEANVSQGSSRRLAVAESKFEQRAMAATSIFTGTDDSFFAANTRPSTTIGSLHSDDPMIPGAWPKSNKFGSKGRYSETPIKIPKCELQTNYALSRKRKLELAIREFISTLHTGGSSAIEGTIFQWPNSPSILPLLDILQNIHDPRKTYATGTYHKFETGYLMSSYARIGIWDSTRSHQSMFDGIYHMFPSDISPHRFFPDPKISALRTRIRDLDSDAAINWRHALDGRTLGQEELVGVLRGLRKQFQGTMALVDYTSSEEETETFPEPPRTNDLKRKRSTDLPPLPSKFHDLYASTTRVSTRDDPSLHGGRKRVTPHIEGNWPSHLYIESEGGRIDINSLLTSDLDVPLPLHISLSRSIGLSTEQKDAFIISLEKAIQSSGIRPFQIRFEGLDWVANFEKTRWFLVLKIRKPEGDGLNRLLHVCNTVVMEWHLPPLYDSSSSSIGLASSLTSNSKAEGRKGVGKGTVTWADMRDLSNAFHVSVAWTLEAPSQELRELTKKLMDEGLGELTRTKVEVEGIKGKVGNVVTNIPLPRNVMEGKSLFGL
ncbi:hypothetical protein B7494_g8059 [Chlorociboria aeruginascens]|nr:hypothetical protein B7494_g8059 [Chlorociboria aeruginascens]